MKIYPDITPILEAKVRRRRELAKLSFEEKIAIVNKMRELTKQIRQSHARSQKENSWSRKEA